MTAGDYGVDAVGVSVRGEPGLGVTARARTNGYPSPLGPLGPLASLSQRHEVAVSVSSSVPTDIRQERSASRNADGLPVLKGESNILFVDGLPTDCTRREVGRILLLFCMPVIISSIRHFQDYSSLCGIGNNCPKSAILFLCFCQFKP